MMKLKKKNKRTTRKPGKPDYRQARAHRVIALLDSMGKLVEKTAAHLIANQLERSSELHDGQYGCRRRRLSIDAVAVLTNHTQQAWKRENVTGAVLMTQRPSTTSAEAISLSA